jgi:hypothetical protein
VQRFLLEEPPPVTQVNLIFDWAGELQAAGERATPGAPGGGMSAGGVHPMPPVRFSSENGPFGVHPMPPPSARCHPIGHPIGVRIGVNCCAGWHG